MSTLDARSSATSDRESRPRGRAAGLLSARHLSLEVRWTWSRRAASRSLGVECSRDVVMTLSLSARGIVDSDPDEMYVEAVVDSALHEVEPPIDAGALGFGPRRLRGTWVESAAFIHLDLRDDVGVFLRASLSRERGGANAVWSRLPGELSIAGGCLSAPDIDFHEGVDAASPSDSAATSPHDHRRP